MSFGDHIEELRTRLLWSVYGLIPLMLVALYFGNYLLGLTLGPVRRALRDAGQADVLQATAPLEAFTTWIKVALVASLIVGAPWLLWNLWKFVAPGLYAHERRFVYLLLPLSTILSLLGVVTLYVGILPLALAWLIHVGSSVPGPTPHTAPVPPGIVLPTTPVLDDDPPHPEPGQQWINRSMGQLRICLSAGEGRPADVRGIPLSRGGGVVSQYRISEYVSFVLLMTGAFALGFQVPVVELLLGWVGLFNQRVLAKYRRHAILGSAILASVITPGDPLSLIAMTLPLYGLYELGGVLLRIFPAERVAAKSAPEDPNHAAE